MALEFVILLLAAIAAVNAFAALFSSQPQDLRTEIGAAVMLLLIAAAIVALAQLPTLVALPTAIG